MFCTAVCVLCCVVDVCDHSVHIVAVLGDLFVVRMTEDPVYGTPFFTTVGGQSKCPGETGTSNRWSGVTITQIIPRCGLDRQSPCDPTTLAVGQPATFGVVIENLSPTGTL